MRTPGFLGLPEKIQTLVIEGLDKEIKTIKSHIKETEHTQPVDVDLLHSLRKDIDRADVLRTRLINGQA